jgi:hypothetical protein
MAAFSRQRNVMMAQLVPPSFSVHYSSSVISVILFSLILIPSSTALLVDHKWSFPFELECRHSLLTSRFRIIKKTKDTMGGLKAPYYYNMGLTTTSMLRNIDLPECIVFYGMETAVIQDEEKFKFPPGFVRFLQEAQDIEIATLLLSEHKTSLQMKSVLLECCNSGSQKFSSRPLSMLELRSSLELPTVMDQTSNLLLVGKGYSPSPAALLDAISSVIIEPKGFGGSGGFGIKHAVSKKRWFL